MKYWTRIKIRNSEFFFWWNSQAEWYLDQHRHLDGGADLMNQLDWNLLKFRESPVAVSNDIQGMFHQVEIPWCNRNWYCFLWLDDHGKVIDWRWTVHPSDSKTLPPIARHALNCALAEQADDDIRDSSTKAGDIFDVDYHLDCSPDVVQVQKKVEIVDQTCQKLGFQLRKWASNNPETFKAIPPAHRAEVGCDVQLGTDC